MAFKYILKVEEIVVKDKDPQQQEIPGTEGTGMIGKKEVSPVAGGDLLEVLKECVVKVFIHHFECYSTLTIWEKGEGGKEIEIQSWKGLKPVERK